MTGTGVHDPEDPGRWLVAPWPADTSIDDVVQHFDRTSTTHLHAGSSTACLLAFHEGFRAALAAAPTEEFTERAHWDRRGYILNCADLGVSIFRDQYLAQYGRDPQAGEDQHVQAVKDRNNPQSPGP